LSSSPDTRKELLEFVAANETGLDGSYLRNIAQAIKELPEAKCQIFEAVLGGSIDPKGIKETVMATKGMGTDVRLQVFKTCPQFQVLCLGSALIASFAFGATFTAISLMTRTVCFGATITRLKYELLLHSRVEVT
jgi:hypothetical protein